MMLFYTGTGNAGTIKAINTTSVSSIWSFTGHGLGVNAIAAAPPSIQPDPPFPGWEDTAPLIRAVDQNGDPVETRRSRRGPSKPKASLTKSRTKRHARRKSSTSWTTSNPISGRHRQVDLSYGDLTDLYNDSQPSGVYPTAHTKGDMGIAGWADTHDLIPRLEFESGEKIYLYAWDGSAGANMGPLADGVTSEHYGEIADDPTFNLNGFLRPARHWITTRSNRPRAKTLRRHPAAVVRTRLRDGHGPGRILPCERAGQRHAGLRDQGW